MRALIGLFLLAAAALFGIETLTKDGPATASGRPEASQLALLASAPGSFGGVVHTVAATQSAPLSPVTTAPDAPRAEPINPIVAPIKKVAPQVIVPAATVTSKHAVGKPAAVNKGKASKAKSAPVLATRPGFKLSCTSAQKLDSSRQKCVPVKGQSTAAASVSKA